MLIKLSHAHPDGFINYLVESDVATREAFFLQASLSTIDNMIKNKKLNHDYVCKVANDQYSKVFEDSKFYNKIGTRGFIYQYVIECDWNISRFIKLREKEYGYA